jgi:AraC family transcriptional activator of pobA
LQEFRDEADRTPEDKQMQQNMLHTLALYLLRSSPNATEARQDYMRLLECIENQYTERPTISELAHALQVSTKRLYAIAATGSGVSPAKLVEQRLVLEAKRRLIHSSEPISAIGFALGFADPAYFSRLFRKHAGQSPRDFREQPR